MFEISVVSPLTTGTTVKGAIDDLDMVIQTLEERDLRKTVFISIVMGLYLA